MTRKQAIAYVRAVIFYGGFPCTYGHYHCAAVEDGPCSNELEGEHNLTDEDI